jgi:hypothetical protein
VTHRPDIVEFVTDPQLLGLSVSPAQEVLLRGIYGLPLVGAEQLDLWKLCTGRETYAAHPFGEVTVLAGARAGKDSRIAAPVAIYEALFGGHHERLSKGERAMIPVVAQDLRATRIAFGYIRDYVTTSPILAGEVEEVLATEITFRNRISVLCFPSTLRSLRGWSIPAAVADEVAFWRLEGQADADVEIQTSIRRGMLAFPSPKLVKISTPYMRSGVLHDDFRKAFGKDDPDLLVFKSPTALMNPTITAARLERERRLDPVRFAREYEAEFADDVDAFLPGAWVDDAVAEGRRELPPKRSHDYLAAVDPSGGGADSFTLSVCHMEGAGARLKIVQDVIRGWGGKRRDAAAADLQAVVDEIAAIIARFHLAEVHGDAYAAGWTRQAFLRAGVIYRESELTKSEAYLEAEPLFAQGRIELLDNPVLVRELKLLERRPRPGGRDQVDHPHGGHDDHANAACLAAALVLDNAASAPRVWFA